MNYLSKVGSTSCAAAGSGARVGMGLGGVGSNDAMSSGSLFGSMLQANGAMSNGVPMFQGQVQGRSAGGASGCACGASGSEGAEGAGESLDQTVLGKRESKKFEKYESKLEKYNSKIADNPEKAERYQEKIEKLNSKMADYSQEKIAKYQEKVEKYSSAMAENPEKSEHYQEKIDKYQARLDFFQAKYNEIVPEQPASDGNGMGRALPCGSDPCAPNPNPPNPCPPQGDGGMGGGVSDLYTVSPSATVDQRSMLAEAMSRLVLGDQQFVDALTNVVQSSSRPLNISVAELGTTEDSQNIFGLGYIGENGISLDPDAFVSMDILMETIAHELAHNIGGTHSDEFYQAVRAMHDLEMEGIPFTGSTMG